MSHTGNVRNTTRSRLGMGSFVFNLSEPFLFNLSGNGTDFRALVTKEVFKAGPVYLPSPKVGRGGAWEV